MISLRFILLIFLFSSLTVGCDKSRNNNVSSSPNVILIMADDLAYSDIGTYGGEIETPNLDQLAEQGIKFTQFYNNAKCKQTRVSLLTGLHYKQTEI